MVSSLKLAPWLGTVSLLLTGSLHAAETVQATLPTTYPAAVGELPAARCAPLIRGVLWWVNPREDGPKVGESIAAMADVGMNLLWIIGTNEFLTQADNPILERIFDEADRRGWRVILATSNNGRWYVDWDIPGLKKIEDRNIPTLARMYAQRPSFFGWYINYEIYMPWDERSRQVRDIFNHIGQVTRAVTPKAKLTISPFFLSDKQQINGRFPWAEPAEYAAYWTETIRQAGIHVVMLQDSGDLHCACVPVPMRIAFFNAMGEACRANGAELWGNVEAVEVPSPDMADYARHADQYRRGAWAFDMKRNAFKLDLASRFCTNIVSWGWEYWNPVRPQSQVGNSKDHYAAYKEYHARLRDRAVPRSEPKGQAGSR